MQQALRPYSSGLFIIMTSAGQMLTRCRVLCSAEIGQPNSHKSRTQASSATGLYLDHHPCLPGLHRGDAGFRSWSQELATPLHRILSVHVCFNLSERQSRRNNSEPTLILWSPPNGYSGGCLAGSKPGAWSSTRVSRMCDKGSGTAADSQAQQQEFGSEVGQLRFQQAFLEDAEIVGVHLTYHNTTPLSPTLSFSKLILKLN